jgi:hypothetical protein
MTTINDIEFDANLYSQFDSWITTLYQINEGIALAIPLNNINLFRFIQHFNEIIPCQHFIKNNDQRTFTLFTYSDNIDTWLWNNNPIPDNLEQIIIFCPFADDRQYFRKWTRRYTRKVIDIITCKALERELLIFGMRYIDNLCSNFQGNQNTLQLLEKHRERIRLALINAFAHAANNI